MRIRIYKRTLADSHLGLFETMTLPVKQRFVWVPGLVIHIIRKG